MMLQCPVNTSHMGHLPLPGPVLVNFTTGLHWLRKVLKMAEYFKCVSWSKRFIEPIVGKFFQWSWDRGHRMTVFINAAINHSS